MSAFLIDEMFPPATVRFLRENFERDAVHVFERGLRSEADFVVAATARAEGRAVVTENVADFVGERDLVLVFVLKSQLPQGSGLAKALADLLDKWVRENPTPYQGPHWPRA
ncbi:hypothetical protein FFT09_18815 [Saccharomonospora piscinae]|uniref:DUF5615 family PIN-like protein n=1 Tax=Saccharomonospora piscinae TaxID=687388 RepID=UPI001105FDED|nr:DUF5615 family PIN-like protein [Saccharomonospora piscinae]TLW91304.1 hypothetical protein FFT09_18815 [Saccharomonospora piscinae]